MKIFCTQENLSKGLNLVSHLASKNVNLPILNNILIKAEGGILKLCATNLEIGITSFVRGKIDEEGECSIPAKVLNDYVNLLSKNNIELITRDENLRVNCGNYQTQIKGINTSEFPLIPTAEEKEGFKIKSSIFKEALQQVIFAAMISEIRPEISGILFSFDNNQLTLVATDSYRLAEKKIKISFEKDKNPESNEDQNFSVIVPLRTAQEILRILSLGDDVLSDNDSDDIRLYIEDSQILLKNNTTELISKLVEGQYPDYKQIIPQDFKTNIIVNKNELQKAIKATSLFTKSGVYDISLKIDVSKNEVDIFAENNQLGRNSVKINPQISGDNNEIVLNFKYLLDGLQSINTEKVVLDIVDNAMPCVVRPYQNESIKDDYLYLVMPIRQ